VDAGDARARWLVLLRHVSCGPEQARCCSEPSPAVQAGERAGGQLDVGDARALPRAIAQEGEPERVARLSAVYANSNL
jgi:hypothetical protein